MKKACINILSSRKSCLPLCLKSLYDFWNHKFDYPVYVHYFDDVYDDISYREHIWDNISRNIHFKPIPYKTPDFLSEDQLFYNRSDIQYARGFGIGRKGYLHMCHFFNNLFEYPNTEFHKYDYMLSIDDESLFLKEVPYDFFDVIATEESSAGVIKLTDPKIKRLHQGVLDTRVGMVDFVVNYISENNLSPKCEFIENLLSDEANREEYFHKNLFVGDSWVFETSLFQTDEWKQWNKAVNESGGIYKYRWGDCELNVLFLMIHYGDLPYDFKTVDEGYHDQGGLRHIQDLAPSIKDVHV